MIKNITEAFIEQIRLTNIYKEECNKFRSALNIKNENPNTTISIYFASLQLEYFISQTIDIINEFKRLNVFKDEFDKNSFGNVNGLWLFCEAVRNNKDNVQQLIDMDFMSSKDRTLRLFNYSPEQYMEILDTWERDLDELMKRLKVIKDTWYFSNKWHETRNDGTFFINKNEMTVYRLIEKPDNTGKNLFVFRKFYKDKNGKQIIKKVSLSPDSVRKNIKEEVFLENKLSEIWPEYFL